MKISSESMDPVLATAFAVSEGDDATFPSSRLSAVAKGALQIPLVAKLLGANTLIVIAALAVHALAGTPSTVLVVVALVIGFAVNTLLVRLALLPFDELERTANAIAGGDLTKRAIVLPTADRQVERLADAFSRLLTRAATDRAQIQHLVRESLRARETERANLARQLREATAQQLSALTLQLAVAESAPSDDIRLGHLAQARGIASQVLAEVRDIADAVYPGLLGRFGLYPALETLARGMRERTGIRVTVELSRAQRALPLAVTTAFFGVAEEAMRNVEQHASARSMQISLADNGRELQLTVEDDGTGFDLTAAKRSFSGIGLFRARELLAHAGGELTVISAPRQGTRVVASAVVQDE